MSQICLSGREERSAQTIGETYLEDEEREKYKIDDNFDIFGGRGNREGVGVAKLKLNFCGTVFTNLYSFKAAKTFSRMAHNRMTLS